MQLLVCAFLSESRFELTLDTAIVPSALLPGATESPESDPSKAQDITLIVEQGK